MISGDLLKPEARIVLLEYNNGFDISRRGHSSL